MKKKQSFGNDTVDWVVKEALAKNEYGSNPKSRKHKKTAQVF
jgi:hypothetical protein